MGARRGAVQSVKVPYRKEIDRKCEIDCRDWTQWRVGGFWFVRAVCTVYTRVGTVVSRPAHAEAPSRPQVAS